jgi:Domain of unknown function (DUF4169)
MAEIVNLRAARKRKAREDADRTAQANRALFGRIKSDKQRERAEKDKARAFVDGHRRDGPDAK